MSRKRINTRRAPHMERFVKVVRYGDSWRVNLDTGIQSFTVDYNPDTKQEALWMRDMLCIALDDIVKQANEGGVK